MRRTFISLAAVAFLATALFLVANGMLSYRNLERLAGAQSRVQHTHEVLVELDGVMSSLRDARAAELDFLVTGNEAHLGEYEAAARRVQERLERVRELTADTVEQVHRLTETRQAVLADLGGLRRAIDGRKRGEPAAVEAEPVPSRAKDAVAGMKQVEQDLLRLRTATSRLDYRRAVTSSALGVAFGLALLAIVYILIRRNLAIRDQAAAVVQEERERFRVTLRSIGDGVIVTDSEGRIIFMNEVAHALTDWTEEAIGQELSQVFRIEREVPGDGVAPPGQRGALLSANPATLVGKYGVRIPIDESTAPVRDDRGEVLGAILVFRDVTERRQEEEERRRADAAKDEFLAMLAHELRTPLAAVRNAIAAANLDESIRDRALEIARRQTGRLTRLVDDLLDVARIQRRKIALRKERISLNEVVQRAVETARPLAQDRGQVLSVSYPPEPIEVEADAIRLEQVIDNLFTNAIKYTPPAGRIALSTMRDGWEAVVTVSDSGMGIGADILPRIFDLFVQTERTLDRADGGLGIGLTIVKLLVELHGGSVEARSEGPGKGAEFTIRLPALEPVQEPALSLVPAYVRGSAPVLVVEDNVDAADALLLLLGVAGFEARVAHDGREALEMAKAESYGLVFVDIGLPGIDGYEVAKRLREIPGYETAYLVALTGYGREEDRERALREGFALHLVKPVEMETLGPLLARLERPAVAEAS